MTTLTPAKNLSLYDLETKFDFSLTLNNQFFQTWLDNSPEISSEEQQIIQRIKTNYFTLNRRRPLLEDLVKMIVVSPLLDFAGFYQQGGDIKTEEKVEYTLEAEDETIRGFIDILLLKENLWLLVIETKRTEINVTSAIPQLLFYMLNRPNQQQQTWGLATNGLEFVFLELTQNSSLHCQKTYALSLERDNELEQVFRALKYLNHTQLNSSP